MISKTPLRFDIDQLQDEYNRIMEFYSDCSSAYRPLQISLVHSLASKTFGEKLQDGCGALGGQYAKEDRNRFDFRHFNEAFKDCYVAEVYRQVQEWSVYHLGRMRFMVRPKHTCYSMHRDADIRYHIAIKTNPDVFFAFRSGTIHHIPADGHLYMSNTLIDHTVFNAGNEDRLHLVFDTLEAK